MHLIGGESTKQPIRDDCASSKLNRVRTAFSGVLSFDR
jgi:hypothetical protein